MRHSLPLLNVKWNTFLIAWSLWCIVEKNISRNFLYLWCF